MSNNDTQAVGRVYLYKYPSKEPVLVLAGQEQFESFGYDFDLSRQLNKLNLIAVSSVKKGNSIHF